MAQKTMQSMTFQLDINEVNLIIKALSDRPFGEVYTLVGKLHAQSSAQLPKAEGAKATPSSKA